MPSRYHDSDPVDSGDSCDLSLPDLSGDGFLDLEFEAPVPGDGLRNSKFNALSSRYRYPDRSLNDVGEAEIVQLTPARARVVELPFASLVTKPTPSTESWKLAGLVFIFLIWVSTASTLLFLYMDRYLFG